MRQKVVKHIRHPVDRNAPYGSWGRVELFLACGHSKTQRGHVHIPDYCYCKECDRQVAQQQTDGQP